LEGKELFNKFKKCYSIRGPIGFLVFAVYRFGNIVFYKVRIPIIRQILMMLFRILELLIIRVIGKAQIPPQTRIGKYLGLLHDANGVIIHPFSVIGDNVILHHQVTIGWKDGYAPIIEDNVVVGVGAKILGKLTIGEGAVIGANAVVIKDVPAGAVAVGVPAKIIMGENRKEKTS
jgi:serine O-acetyltransferase